MLFGEEVQPSATEEEQASCQSFVNMSEYSLAPPDWQCQE